MEANTMRVAPAISGIPNIHTAARVLRGLTVRSTYWSSHQNTATNKGVINVEQSVLLGVNEIPITYQTLELGERHIPNAVISVIDMTDDDEQRKFATAISFRNAVTGFLALADKIPYGHLSIGEATRFQPSLYVPDLIGEFAAREFPELATHWSVSGRFSDIMSNNLDNAALRLAWFLRDKASGYLFTYFPPSDIAYYGKFLEAMKTGRVTVLPSMDNLFYGLSTRITALTLKNGYRISAFGSVHKININREGSGYEKGLKWDDLFGDWHGVKSLTFKDSKYVLEIPVVGGKTFSIEYAPDEVASVQITQAKDPEIKVS